jgi:YfiH family protein
VVSSGSGAGWRRTLPRHGGGTAEVAFTERSQGDFAVDAEPGGLAARRRAVADRPWVWLRQVHGAEVVVVPDDGTPPAEAAARWSGAEADALVTARTDVALAVQTADCAPVALLSPDGAVAAVHAGWRGLEAGVVQAAAAAAEALGATRLEAVLGPCIHPADYAFGPDELDRLADRFGPAVRARTRDGRPALDVPAAVDAALAEAGLGPAERIGVCTAATPERAHSHRARGDRGRQAAVVLLRTGSGAPDGSGLHGGTGPR